MASTSLFEGIPPFPDGLPIAKIPLLSLAGLMKYDVTVSEKLLKACQRLGFFMLDLQGDALGEVVIREVEDIWALMKESMNLPIDIKAKYAYNPPETFLGWKLSGRGKTETKQPDRYEYWNLGQDGLLGNVPLQSLPDSILRRRELLASFLKHGQTIISLICRSLASQLSLPPSTFTDLQSPAKESGTMIRFIKVAASLEPSELRTSLMHHTDFGTVTLLVNVLGGLQILAPGKEASDPSGWSYVQPQPGCLIVNLGDAMTQWTDGILRSNCHRIYYAPGQQRFVDRYSMAILARPEKVASMRRLVKNGQRGLVDDETEAGQSITAHEWERRKAMALTNGQTLVFDRGVGTVD